MVIRVEVPPRIGEKVVDEKLKQVGAVFDVFGPVSKPYITIKASIENPTPLVNQILYMNPSSKTAKKGRRRGINGGR